LKESAFWGLVNKNLSNMHIQRIETGGTGRGIPDFNACCEGTEFWVELKVVNAGKKVGLRPEQVGWLVKRSMCGGKCFVLVRTPTAEIYLYKGEDARQVADDGLRLTPELCLKKPYDWELLIKTFLK
jgi:Holliday junction resolvase